MLGKKRDTITYTWNDLAGKIAQEVFCAPRTGGDPTGDWPKIHPRIIKYLVRNVLGKPWANHLALLAAVLTAQRRDVATVGHALTTLHPRFSSLFPLFELEGMSQWNIDVQYLIY